MYIVHAILFHIFVYYTIIYVAHAIILYFTFSCILPYIIMISIVIQDCGPLTDPSNGAVAFESTLNGSVANYTCNVGYIASGDETRTCLISITTVSGVWSGQPPSCTCKTTFSTHYVLMLPLCVWPSQLTYVLYSTSCLYFVGHNVYNYTDNISLFSLFSCN